MDESTKVMSSVITGADLSFKTSGQLKRRQSWQSLPEMFNKVPCFHIFKKQKQFNATKWMASTSRREPRAAIQEEVALYFRAGLQQEEGWDDL